MEPDINNEDEGGSIVKMKKPILLFLSIFLPLLCGCSARDEVCPEYFEPILQEVEANREEIRQEFMFVMDNWMDDIAVVGSGGAYSDKTFTAYIDGEYIPFDLRNELTDAEQWEWEVAGAFYGEGHGETYILLSDFNIIGDDEMDRNPQMLLLEFPSDAPEAYQVTSYTVEPATLFAWVDSCYRMGNKLYIVSHDNMGIIDLETKELHICSEEYAAMEKYARETQKIMSEESYSMCMFRAILEQDDVTVFSANISDGSDACPVGLVFAAFRDDKPIAYMSVDLTAEDNGLKIEEVSE